MDIETGVQEEGHRGMETWSFAQYEWAEGQSVYSKRGNSTGLQTEGFVSAKVTE